MAPSTTTVNLSLQWIFEKPLLEIKYHHKLGFILKLIKSDNDQLHNVIRGESLSTCLILI